MNDPEMTRLCAEAIDEPYIGFDAKGHKVYCEYDPLHDDAQLMALGREYPELFAEAVTKWAPYGLGVDLNRMFCKCVAKMQEAK